METCSYTVGMTHVDEPVFCPDLAVFEIFRGDETRPDAPSAALACREHVGYLLSDDIVCHVYPYTQPKEA